jgi:hypothetical protein
MDRHATRKRGGYVTDDESTDWSVRHLTEDLGLEEFSEYVDLAYFLFLPPFSIR